MSILQPIDLSIERIVGDIVIAFLQTQTISAEQLPELVVRVRAALAGNVGQTVRSDDARCAVEARNLGHYAVFDEGIPVEASPTPAETRESQGLRPPVPIADSVHPDYLVSLEDGKRYKSLKRHLKSKFNLTPEDYRAKWGLPDDYPMVAPSYAQRRSELAKSYDFGRAHRRGEGSVSMMKPRTAKGK